MKIHYRYCLYGKDTKSTPIHPINFFFTLLGAFISRVRLGRRYDFLTIKKVY